MKKILFLIILVFNFYITAFANNGNLLPNISLRNFEIINPNSAINYTYDGIYNISYIKGSESVPYYYNPGIALNISYLNENFDKLADEKKEVDLLHSDKIVLNDFYPYYLNQLQWTNIEYNREFLSKFANIPNGTKYYKVTPILSSKIDLYYIKSELTRTVSTFNQAVLMAQAQYDYYNDNESYENLFLDEYGPYNSDILVLKEKYSNGFMLKNGPQVFFKKLKNYCYAFDNSESNYDDACGIITIDINGKGLPNELSTTSVLKDRFNLLLFSNKVVPPKNTIEYDIINKKSTIDYVSPAFSFNDETKTCYEEFLKNLTVWYTLPVIRIITDNPTDESKKAQVEVKFYNENDVLIDTLNYTWEIATNDDTKDFPMLRSGFININTLHPNAKYFDITIKNIE